MYTFTRTQLGNLLDANIRMFIEYRDVHEKNEVDALFAAVAEMLEGLDADKDMHKLGEPLMLQEEVQP
jgi:hypothetical protein